MTFDEVTDWSPEGDAWTMTLPPQWMQGRGAFGGILAAAALRAMRTLVEPDRTPRCVTTTFLGPVTSEPVTMTARVLRAGKSVAFAEAEISQAGTARVRVQGVFGADRPSELMLRAEPVVVPAVHGLPRFPYLPGITPEFIQCMDMRWAEGGVPFSSSEGSTVASHMRFTEPAARGYERILALLDVLPAPVLQNLSQPAPASTIAWTAHFCAPDESQPGDFSFMRYDTVTAEHGYCTAIGKLYDQGGRLIAWQEQLQAVFG